MTAATADWLAAQRWFRAKHRRVASVTEVDRAEVGPGVLVVVEIAYAASAPGERYLLALVDDRDPADGEGLWSSLVEAMGADRRIGPFAASRAPAFEAVMPADERRLTVEQSNTSVAFGELLMLKLYRLVEPGINPDIEMSAFLTHVGFGDTPPLAGSLAYAPDGSEPAAAAMLQAMVPAAGDAWAAMLDALAHGPERGLELAAQVGNLTARLHAALASRPDLPDFPARPATVSETAAWRASAERQLAEAVAAVEGPAHGTLVALAPRVTASFADSFGSASGATRVSRVHGDYHLGQLLVRAGGGISVIDFEGEPARPLAERRRPASPLRDVAGMLRSLDYAARTAERSSALDADAWLRRARPAFLEAYGVIDATDAALLVAFELEKACYEVRYEASNRPNWLWLPLSAVERLTGDA
jgi:trehalose synthase-fused probable maltokinase